jgi:hypothetical protein
VISSTRLPLYLQGKRLRYPLDRRLGGATTGLGAVGQRTISCPCQESNHDRPAIAGRYTDWAIVAPKLMYWILPHRKHSSAQGPTGHRCLVWELSRQSTVILQHVVHILTTVRWEVNKSHRSPHCSCFCKHVTLCYESQCVSCGAEGVVSPGANPTESKYCCNKWMEKENSRPNLLNVFRSETKTGGGGGGAGEGAR